MSSSLSGRVAIVTDSTRGVCLALTKELAENNDSSFIACSRNKERAEELAEEINGSAFGIGLNLTSDSSVLKLVSEVMANQRLIDILLNNAGYSFDRPNLVKRFHEVTEQPVLL